MKAISFGNQYEIHDNTLQIYDKLPAQTYIIRFSKMSGFYLEKYNDMEIKEDKVYGIHEAKVEKVLRTFDMFNRNLGVILSGKKGIGKSLFAKLLSIKAVERGMPLIIVDKFIPGIASYIEKIEQEVVILFDEFDKTFANIHTGENEADPQAGLLSLFDGVASGKKLFVITCNSLHNLNDYLINRPGRFHYHFRFSCPTAEEVREYLMDKLQPQYRSEIDKVILFSKKTNVNYDCLRAIVFELNTGEPFEEAIKDLNIINIENEIYNVILEFKDGTKMTNENIRMDLFDKIGKERFGVYDYNGNDIITVEFSPADCIYDYRGNVTIVSADKLHLMYDDDDYCKEEVEKVRMLEPDRLIIERCKERNFHYDV